MSKLKQTKSILKVKEEKKQSEQLRSVESNRGMANKSAKEIVVNEPVGSEHSYKGLIKQTDSLGARADPGWTLDKFIKEFLRSFRYYIKS